MQKKIANYIVYDTSTNKEKYGEVLWLVEQVVQTEYDVEDCGYEFLNNKE